MSKTITKKAKNKANVSHVKAALALMGVNVAADQCRLYSGQLRSADLVFTSQMLQEWGLHTAYGTDVGVTQTPDGIEFVYDHANERLVEQLGMMLPGFGQLGMQADSVRALVGQGYKLRPHIDAEAQEYGVYLEAPQGQQHVGWGNADEKDGGGVW